MTENQPKSSRGQFSAVVRANTQIGGRFYRLGLDFEGAGAEAFAGIRPGQFAQLELCRAALPAAEAIPAELADAAGREILLRRPFSFCDVTAKKDKTLADILYRVVGPATLRMTTLAKGDSVSVIGPLGNGFRMPDGKRMAVLVAGGIGAGPLEYLAKTLTADCPDIEVMAFAGARTAEELPFEKRLDGISQGLGFWLAEFAGYGVKSQVATDDGSAGYEGLVTDCLAEWLGRGSLAAEGMIIYGCGPEPMLAKVAEIAQEKNIDCQVSMERMMACGIGICQSCAVECRVEGSNKTVYKLCCEDGPVFDSREIIFSL